MVFLPFSARMLMPCLTPWRSCRLWDGDWERWPTPSAATTAAAATAWRPPSPSCPPPCRACAQATWRGGAACLKTPHLWKARKLERRPPDSPGRLRCPTKQTQQLPALRRKWSSSSSRRCSPFRRWWRAERRRGRGRQLRNLREKTWTRRRSVAWSRITWHTWLNSCRSRSRFFTRSRQVLKGWIPRCLSSHENLVTSRTKPTGNLPPSWNKWMNKALVWLLLYARNWYNPDLKNIWSSSLLHSLAACYTVYIEKKYECFKWIHPDITILVQTPRYLFTYLKWIYACT